MEATTRYRGVFRMCGQEQIEQLSRDGSHYSLSTGILPSLGARSSNRRVKLRRFIISPYDKRYRFFFFRFFGFLGFASFCFVLFFFCLNIVNPNRLFIVLSFGCLCNCI